MSSEYSTPIIQKKISMNEYNFYKLLQGKDITPEVIEIKPNDLKMVEYFSTLQNVLLELCLTDQELESLIKKVKTLIKRFHSLGYIHGDLHTGNIICNSDLSEVRLIDFENSTFSSVVDQDYLDWYNKQFDTSLESAVEIMEHELENFTNDL